MRIKRLNEQIDISTLDILSNYNLTEGQYIKILEYVFNCSYPEVKKELPFLKELEKNYQEWEIDRIISFYKKKKKMFDIIEETEDPFLIFKDDPSYGIEVNIIDVSGYSPTKIEIKFEIKSDLNDTVEKLNKINSRMKLINIKYKTSIITKNITSFGNSWFIIEIYPQFD